MKRVGWIARLAAAVAVAAGAGCSKNAGESVFATADAVAELNPKARQAVEAEVRASFGTPQQLVAWEAMPVDYGGSGPTASVAESDGPRNTRRSFAVAGLPARFEGWDSYVGLTLKFGPAAQPEDAAEGDAAAEETAEAKPSALAGVTATIAAYDAKTARLTLTEDLASVPAAGETFTVEDPGWKLRDGRNLYMRHCLHCHGVAGDGNGPTAKYLNPRPRDYRLGVFKFTSTNNTSKANRSDLKRTLQEGIPGTSMPSFLLLADHELDQLVEYVRWLAMRGEYERALANELADYKVKTIADRTAKGEKAKEILAELDTFLQQEFAEVRNAARDRIAEDWKTAELPESLVIPTVKRTEPTPESIARGRALYMSDRAKCYTCHGLGGKGDGVSTVDYWEIPSSSPSQKYAVRGLHDTWNNPQKPRNLTLGVYRGGRRPIDIFRRIHAGIKGTQMAAFGGSVFKDDEIWDIVNYVLDVPFQSQTPDDPPPAATAGEGNRTGTLHAGG